MVKKKQSKNRGKNVSGRRGANNNLYYWIIGAVVILGLILFFVFKSSDDISGTNNKNIFSNSVSPAELVENKEKYEGQSVKILNILVPDPLFAYVEKTDGIKERLFISPKKSEYCLYFNLYGKLQRDATRGWMFYVDTFECVAKS